MVGGVAPDAPVACVLSKVSSSLGLGLVLAVPRCGTSGAAPVVVQCASPGVLAGVIPVTKDAPTSCGSAPALDDDSPISGDDEASSSNEDAPAPVDDAPAVVDNFFFS